MTSDQGRLPGIGARRRRTGRVRRGLDETLRAMRDLEKIAGIGDERDIYHVEVRWNRTPGSDVVYTGASPPSRNSS